MTDRFEHHHPRAYDARTLGPVARTRRLVSLSDTRHAASPAETRPALDSGTVPWYNGGVAPPAGIRPPVR